MQTEAKITDIELNARTSSEEQGIWLQDVTKKYEVGEHTLFALKNATLTIEKGELIVILGPSGSGKTTMLNLIGGIDRVSSGEIRVNGIPIDLSTNLTKFRRENISYVFQFFNLIPTLTAQENVEFALQLVMKGKKRKEIEKEALRHLDDVGLAKHAKKFPAECSGGEQQRIAISRALAKKTPIVLADEPTGELDFETGRLILKLLRKIPDEGRIVILVTHNSEIAKIADRIIYLRGGEITKIQDNTANTISINDLIW